MRRRIFRLLLFLLLLNLLAAVSIQVLLWTDLPRQWVLESLQDQLGIQVEADSLQTGWTGHSTISTLSLTLPMETTPFLNARQVEISHSNLIRLLFGSVQIYSLDITDPVFHLQQSEDGQWNVAKIISTLENAPFRQKETAADGAWPRIEIRQAEVIVYPWEKPEQKVAPLHLQGEMDHSLCWKFSLDCPDMLNLTGQVVPQGIWDHKVKISVEPSLSTALGSLWPENVSPLHIQGSWQGQIRDAALEGQLVLKTLQVGETHLQGSIHLNTKNNQVQLRPEMLTVQNKDIFTQPVIFRQGEIYWQERQIMAHQLILEQVDLLAEVTGCWDLHTRRGRFQGSWIGNPKDSRIQHEGKYAVTLQSPIHGRREMHVQLNPNVRLEQGHWQAEMEAHGFGPAWDETQWQVSVPSLQGRQGKQQMNVKNLEARLQVNGSRVQLIYLQAPDPMSIRAQGQYDQQNKTWSLELAANKVKIIGTELSPLDVQLTARGDPNQIQIATLHVKHPQAQIKAAGILDWPSLKILQLHTQATGDLQQAMMSIPADSQVQGQWRLDGEIQGKLRPVDLQLAGKFYGTDVMWRKKKLVDLTIPWQSQWQETQLEIMTEPFSYLDGRWKLEGNYNFTKDSGWVQVSGQEISLASLGEFADPPLPWKGKLSTDLTLEVLDPNLDSLQVTGSWRAQQVDIPPFHTETAEGKVNVSQGFVRLQDIKLRQDKGIAQAQVQFRLTEPEKVQVQAMLHSWPVGLKNYDIQTHNDGEVDFLTNVRKVTVHGKGNLTSRIFYQDKPFGQFRTRAELEGSHVYLRDFEFNALEGKITGQAEISLESWLHSRAEFKAENVDLNQLAAWWPELKDLQGRLQGGFSIRPAEVPRPLEPLQLDAKLHIDYGSYRGAALNKSEIRAFAGAKRFLIDQSQTELMSGRLEIRGGWARHAGKIQTHLHTRLDHIDLNQLAHVIDPNAPQIAGLVEGTGMLVTSSDLHRLMAKADLQLTKSDLMNHSVVSLLYNTLNLNFDSEQPEGKGRIKLYAAGKTLQIPSFEYYNRGVEIRGAGAIQDLHQDSASPVDGYAIAMTRPLKGTKLPGVRDLDELIHSLQKGIASVEISGTLGRPESSVVPFPEIRSAFRRLLWGQLREDASEPKR
jgi:hypothetical protein